VDVVAYAPRTRPDRYTILEHLDLSPVMISGRLADYIDAVGD
jgi:glycerol-1-phosphate dehydrogenase [NAD(P)+]